MAFLIGAVLAYLVSKNLWAALIGGFIAWLVFQKNRPTLASSAHQIPMQLLYLRALSSTMGRIAKADGRISELEIQFAEALFQHLNLNGEQRQQAIAWFKQGAEDEVFWRHELRQFAQVSRFKPQLRQNLLEWMIQLALFDGQLHQQERQVLQEVAGVLGIPASAFDLFLQQFMARRNFHQQYQNQNSYATNRSHLAQAYQILNVSEDDSDAVIKKAYRKLMSENHPDKLMAQGLPEAAIKQATEKTQVIQEAYDLIKKSRQV